MTSKLYRVNVWISGYAYECGDTPIDCLTITADASNAYAPVAVAIGMGYRAAELAGDVDVGGARS